MNSDTGFGFGGGAAQLYERYIVPNVTGPWAEALVKLAAIRQGERVLDVACGTGVVARAAALAVGSGGEVVGLDVNADMLSVARSVAAQGGAQLSWREADVANTGLGEGQFDVVLSQQGYQYFPDKDAALRELHRVLAPGGRILMTVWKGHSIFTTALTSALIQHVSQAAGEQMDSQRTPPSVQEMREHMSGAGFTEPSIMPQDLSLSLPLSYIAQHLSAIPVSSAFKALKDSARSALLSQIEDKLGEHIANGHMVIPDTVYVLCGRK